MSRKTDTSLFVSTRNDKGRNCDHLSAGGELTKRVCFKFDFEQHRPIIIIIINIYVYIDFLDLPFLLNRPERLTGRSKLDENIDDDDDSNCWRRSRRRRRKRRRKKSIYI